MDAKEVSNALNKRASEIASHLVPWGRKCRHEWVAGDAYGEKGESLKIRISNGKVGVWCDFSTGEKGDLLDLWKLVNRCDFPTALTDAKRYLGVSDDPERVGTPAKTFTRPSKPMCSAPKDKVLNYLMDGRKLTPETLNAFKIGQSGDDIVLPYLRDGELIHWKKININRHPVTDKKIISTSAGSELGLFGWQALDPDAREIYITEGEIDAMTLHQYGYPALSVPNGANADWIENEYTRLEQYSTIYLCMDDDEAGKKVIPALARRLGEHRVKIVTLPGKDANACLLAGFEKNHIQLCIDGAEEIRPAELRCASTYLAATIAAFYPPEGGPDGYSLPWEKHKNDFKLRGSEVSIWTGINGHGKSQLLGHVVLGLLEQGERVCVASMELPPPKLLKGFTRQATAMAMPALEYITAVFDWYAEKLYIYDLTGRANVDRLLETLAYARKRHDTTTFVIDSMMKCGIDDDDYKGQKNLMEKLCEFSHRYDCHIALVAHSRKLESEYAPPGKMDIKGTGTLTDMADSVYSVWRNKKKEDCDDGSQNDAPDAVLVCHKQREIEGSEGKIPLWFDRDSLQFLNYSSEKPKRYVNYSTLGVTPASQEVN